MHFIRLPGSTYSLGNEEIFSINVIYLNLLRFELISNYTELANQGCPGIWLSSFTFFCSHLKLDATVRCLKCFQSITALYCRNGEGGGRGRLTVVRLLHQEMFFKKARKYFIGPSYQPFTIFWRLFHVLSKIAWYFRGTAGLNTKDVTERKLFSG